MNVIFWKPKFRLPQSIKREICLSIKKNYMGNHGLNFYIHFDVMLRKGNRGWYAGYLDTWQGWRTNPYRESLGRRRRRIVVQVLDYGEEYSHN
jgi:hypothetical protein